MVFANSTFALTRSTLPRKTYDSNSCGTYGRISADSSVRILITSLRSSASSSRTLLLASTTSAGSTNTVFPVADSSCTIPFILLFSVGATGITSRPSLSVGATSLSTSPSLWAARNILYKVREILPSVFAKLWRMSARAGEAVSFTLPNLSIIWSILLTMFGKAITPSAMSCSDG